MPQSDSPVLDRYQALVAKGRVTDDPDQRVAVSALDAVAGALRQPRRERALFGLSFAGWNVLAGAGIAAVALAGAAVRSNRR